MSKVLIIPVLILRADKDRKCYQPECMNKIRTGQVYALLTSDKSYPLNTCAKCMDKWYQEVLKELDKEKLNMKNEQAKFQELAEKYYGVKEFDTLKGGLDGKHL